MDFLPLVLVILVCPLVMGVVMWLMMRAQRGSDRRQKSDGR
jgi:hypothetical protein